MSKASNSLIQKKLSQSKEIWRRYRKNKLAMLGLIIFIIFFFLLIFPGIFGTYDESITQDIMNKQLPPSSEHWFGTDNYGRDIFLRCVYGTRTSLLIGVLSSVFAMIGGCIVGLTAGFYGGKYDSIIMRIMDIISSIPSILSAMCLMAALGASSLNLIIALSYSRIPAFARIVRSSTLSISGKEYIEAARAGAIPDWKILVKHILPNILGPVIVQATTNVAQMILQIASLSFLGLGVPAPTPEWGAIISGAKAFLRTQPYMLYFPGLFIILASLGINLIGDGLRDALDPRLKN